MLPDVGSTIVPPGRSFPSRSAASIIASPIRSLFDPPGFRNSSFASSVGGTVGAEAVEPHDRRAADEVEQGRIGAAHGPNTTRVAPRTSDGSASSASRTNEPACALDAPAPLGEALDLDSLTRLRRMDDLAAADVEPDVAEPVEEDEVAGPELTPTDGSPVASTARRRCAVGRRRASRRRRRRAPSSRIRRGDMPP